MKNDQYTYDKGEACMGRANPAKPFGCLNAASGLSGQDEEEDAACKQQGKKDEKKKI